jgi:hypothetical protein
VRRPALRRVCYVSLDADFHLLLHSFGIAVLGGNSCVREVVVAAVHSVCSAADKARGCHAQHTMFRAAAGSYQLL